jgi:hypothetical protein
MGFGIYVGTERQIDYWRTVAGTVYQTVCIAGVGGCALMVFMFLFFLRKEFLCGGISRRFGRHEIPNIISVLWGVVYY